MHLAYILLSQTYVERCYRRSFRERSIEILYRNAFICFGLFTCRRVRQTFSVLGQIENISRFECHWGCVTTTQICSCSSKAAKDTKSNRHGQIWPQPMVCLPLACNLRYITMLHHLFLPYGPLLHFSELSKIRFCHAVLIYMHHIT